MSRLKKFAHSLVSGYVLLGSNVVFSLASIPLAFRYLTPVEFGLWALVSQIAAYLSLIDMGMSSSVGRALFDFKDQREDGRYGSVIVTGQLVLVLQGVLVVFLGVAGTPSLGGLLKIPAELQGEFFSLMWWQCAVTGAGFTSKIFQHLLVAQHRYEINNYAQAAVFALNLVLLWFFFDLGWKLASLPAANAVCWIVSSAITLVACRKLGVFPKRGHWGRLNFRLLRDMLGFGLDVFLVTVGAQLILASQTIVVTRTMGLEASAVWSVCTKTYSLICQLVWRIYDYSGSAFVEMIVRGERQRLRDRFREVITVSASVSTLAAVGFAVVNEPFVTLWTSGRVSWSNLNNVLLAVWLVLVSILRCQGGLVLLTKRIGFLRYVYFIEGVVFFGVANIVAETGGFAAILITSIVCTVCFTGLYGVRRVVKYLDISYREFLMHWLAPMYRLVVGLIPLALFVWFSSLDLSDRWRFLINSLLMGTAGVALFLRFGLSRAIRIEVLNRASSRVRPALARAFGVEAH